jgi:hypothetical protein
MKLFVLTALTLGILGCAVESGHLAMHLFARGTAYAMR